MGIYDRPQKSESIYTVESNNDVPTTLEGKGLEESIQVLAKQREESLSNTDISLPEEKIGTQVGRKMINELGQRNLDVARNEAALSLAEEGDRNSVLSLLQDAESYSIEKAAVDQALYVEKVNNDEFSTVVSDDRQALLEQHADNKAGDLVVAEYMNRFTSEFEEQSAWKTARNFAYQFVPFVTPARVATALNKFWGFSGDNLQEAHQEFIKRDAAGKRQMLDEVVQNMEDNGWYEDPEEMMGIIADIAGITDNQQWWRNFWDIADIGGTVASGGTLNLATGTVKGVRGTVSTFKSMGAPKQAAEQVKAIENSSNGSKASEDAIYDSVNSMVPSVINEAQQGIPLIKDVRIREMGEEFESAFETQLDLSGVSNISFVKTFDDEEILEAVGKSLEEIRESYPDKINFDGKDIDLILFAEGSVSRVTGATELRTRLGVRTGKGLGKQKGFVSSERADEFAKATGIEDYDIAEVNGLFYIDSFHVVKPEFSNAWVKGQGTSIPVNSLLRGADLTNPLQLSRMTHLTGDAKAQISRYYNDVVDDIRKLDKDEMNTFNIVAEESRRDELWFTPDQLRDKGMGEQGIAAYNRYREVQDMKFYIDNAIAYSDLSQRGYKNIEVLDNGKVTSSFRGEPIETEFGNYKGRTVFDSDAAGDSTRVLSDQDIRKLESGDKILVRLDDMEDVYSEHSAQFIMMDKRTAQIKPLSKNILQYRAGGRIDYDGDYFVGFSRINENATQVTMRRGRVFGNAKTVEEANALAKSVNASLDVMRRRELSDAQKSILLERTLPTSLAKYADVDAFNKFMKDAGIKLYRMQNGRRVPTAMEVRTGKGYFPSETAALSSEKFVRDKMDDSYIGSLQSVVYGHGNSYSKRGKRLIGLNDEQATLASPFESMNNVMKTLRRTSTTEQYRRRLASEWADEFKSVLDPADRRPLVNRFFDPKYKRNLTPEEEDLVGQANVIQKNAEAFLNMDTPMERSLNNAWRSIGRKFGLDLTDSLSGRPIDAAKNMVFHAKLGLFNPKQIPTQLTQLVNVGLIAGADAPKVVGVSFLAKMALRGDDNTVELFARAAQGFGYSKDEFKAVIKELRENAKTDIKGTYSEADIAAGDLKSGRIRDVLKHSGFFFEQTEGFVRLNAYVAAREKFLAQNPLKRGTVFSDVDKATLSRMTDNFSGSMVEASKSQWQRGFAGAMTQFSSYAFRLGESLVSAKILTPAERTRLALGLLGMWGVGGVTANGFAQAMFSGFVPETEFETGMKKMITDGALEAFFYGMLGVEADFGGRMAPRLLEAAFGVAFEDKNAVEVILGPAGSTAYKAGGGVAEAIVGHVRQFGTDDVATADKFTGFLTDVARPVWKEISTANHFAKVYTAMKTKEIMDSYGEIAVKNIDAVDTMLLTLGIEPEEIARAFYGTAPVKMDEKYAEWAIKNVKKEWKKLVEGEITTDEFLKVARTNAYPLMGNDALYRRVVGATVQMTTSDQRLFKQLMAKGLKYDEVDINLRSWTEE